MGTAIAWAALSSTWPGFVVHHNSVLPQVVVEELKTYLFSITVTQVREEAFVKCIVCLCAGL